MSQFPLSDLRVLSEIKAEVVPPEPPPAALPAVKGPEDGLSCVLRDAQNNITMHEGLVGKAVEVLRSIFDPEIPVNIYDLGLIYEVKEEPAGSLQVVMTLTSPMCPVAGSLPPDVKNRIEAVTGADACKVDVIWDPPWGPEKMSDAARLTLNMF